MKTHAQVLEKRAALVDKITPEYTAFILGASVAREGQAVREQSRSRLARVMPDVQEFIAITAKLHGGKASK